MPSSDSVIYVGKKAVDGIKDPVPRKCRSCIETLFIPAAFARDPANKKVAYACARCAIG